MFCINQNDSHGTLSSKISVNHSSHRTHSSVMPEARLKHTSKCYRQDAVLYAMAQRKDSIANSVGEASKNHIHSVRSFCVMTRGETIFFALRTLSAVEARPQLRGE